MREQGRPLRRRCGLVKWRSLHGLRQGHWRTASSLRILRGQYAIRPHPGPEPADTRLDHAMARLVGRHKVRRHLGVCSQLRALSSIRRRYGMETRATIAARAGRCVSLATSASHLILTCEESSSRQTYSKIARLAPKK